MKFMELFKKSNERESAYCANQPNTDCSSIEKIRQLQEEIKSLYKKRDIKFNSDIESMNVISNIIDCDNNLYKRTYCSSLIDYDIQREIKRKLNDFIFLFDSLEDESKNKIIDFLTSHAKTKYILKEINCKINILKNQIKTEKQKLGIE